MLILLDSKEEKVAAQEQFEEKLRQAWPEHESRTVTWKSGDGKPGKAEMDIAHNGCYWFFSNKPHDGQNTKRYWNSVGRYLPGQPLQIIVEMNIATESNSESVAGFFAKDTLTGMVCLMHTGKVGGGRKGIGKNAFWAWSKSKPVEAWDRAGNVRSGIVITHLASTTIGEDITRFLEKVDGFKHAVKNDEVEAAGEQDTDASYNREFSGIKKGERSREIEYLTWHGDIVDALEQWRREQTPLNRNEKTFNTQLIDLGVRTAKNKLLEIYEVKTNLARQTLYTAIGQVMVHGSGDVKRFLVLPTGSGMPDDVQDALRALGIGVLKFKMTAKKVVILAGK